MTKFLFAGATALGAATIAWMGAGFAGSDALAFTVTAIIGGAYLIGVLELVRFRQATASLSSALAGLPGGSNGDGPAPADWVKQLHPSLQNPVKLRIEGEASPLPAPVITPYLVGLLVMLGLLGTFAGMVDTLQGAVATLEGSTELAAIRNGMAAPIAGLGVAFGTSVAGIAASAMLGLAATLSRRERLLAGRELDSQIGGAFLQHSLTYQRQQTYSALQQQADTLPAVAQQLQSLAGSLERMGEKLTDTLISNQQQFHASATQAYQDLANSVGQALNASLADSGKLAGESLRPQLEAAMQGIGQQAESTHQALLHSAQAQSESVSAQLSGTLEAITTAIASADEQRLRQFSDSLAAGQREAREQLAEATRNFSAEIGAVTAAQSSAIEAAGSAQAQALEALTLTQKDAIAASCESQQSALAGAIASQEQALTAVIESQRGVLAESGESQQAAMQAATRELVELAAQLKQQWQQAGEQSLQVQSAVAESIGGAAKQLQQEFTALREGEQARNDQAIERLASLEGTVADNLAALGQGLEAPMSQLIEVASEAPQAAAEVITRLQEEIANNTERDNKLLQERREVLEDLHALSGSLQAASSEQREAVAELVNSSAAVLQEVGVGFGDHVASQGNTLTEISANFAGSAAEMASLGEAFTLAVQLFNDSNQGLGENLARIESALDNTSARSDEQMAYYVAQAREIIDQSMFSQREIIEELRQLGRTEDLFEQTPAKTEEQPEQDVAAQAEAG